MFVLDNALTDRPIMESSYTKTKRSMLLLLYMLTCREKERKKERKKEVKKFHIDTLY